MFRFTTLDEYRTVLETMVARGATPTEICELGHTLEGWEEYLTDLYQLRPLFDESDPMTWGDLPHGYTWREIDVHSGEHHLFAPDGRDVSAMYR